MTEDHTAGCSFKQPWRGKLQRLPACPREDERYSAAVASFASSLLLCLCFGVNFECARARAGACVCVHTCVCVCITSCVSALIEPITLLSLRETMFGSELLFLPRFSLYINSPHQPSITLTYFMFQHHSLQFLSRPFCCDL